MRRMTKMVQSIAILQYVRRSWLAAGRVFAKIFPGARRCKCGIVLSGNPATQEGSSRHHQRLVKIALAEKFDRLLSLFNRRVSIRA